MKCEAEYSDEVSTNEPVGDPADDPTDDRSLSDSDDSSSFDDDDSEDSDYVCEIETKKKRTAKNEEGTENKKCVGDGETKETMAGVAPKPKGRRKTKAQTEELTNKTEAGDENDAKAGEVDSNAPKKKRKYKKRAIKEKQTFECDICHYKCAHQCM